jgi:hypothetical protein
MFWTELRIANGLNDVQTHMTDLRHQRQLPVSQAVALDTCPIQDWIGRFMLLVPMLYPADAALAKELGLALQDLSSSAADLDCIGTDDASAPPVDGPADEVLAYFFRRYPETRALQRLISRADQVLGRQTLMRTVSCSHIAKP